MINDPSRPLKKTAHEAFAVHYAVNGNAAAAWVHATAGNPAHSDGNGSKWLQKGSISERVAWLKAEAGRRLRAQADREQEPVLLTLMEKRRFLSRVVRTPIGEVDESSDLCQAVEIGDKGGRKYKMPDKIAAIKLDNDLAGDGSEAKANDALSEVAMETLNRIFGNA